MLFGRCNEQRGEPIDGKGKSWQSIQRHSIAQHGREHIPETYDVMTHTST